MLLFNGAPVRSIVWIVRLFMASVCQELAADVANLGEPVEVFSPGPAAINKTNISLALLCVLTGLLVLAGASIFIAELIQPLGKDPLPREIAWGGAIGCGVIALTFLGFAGWFGARIRVTGRQEFHFHKDALVEVVPNRRRVIPWEQIGSQRPTSGFAKTHRFPVAGGKDLRFNYEIPNHEALAKAIAGYALAHTLRRSLGGDQAMAALANGRPAGHFVGRTQSWTGGETYRITAIGDCLLFLKVATGFMSAKPQANAFGALGAVAAAGPVWRYMKFIETMRKLDGLDAGELVRAAGQYEGSFLLKAAEIRGFAFESPSLVRQLCTAQKHAGLLVLSRHAGEALRLELPEPADPIHAREELARVAEHARDN
jgi:hypothetical protein